jgi:hypothetical protein
MHFIVTFMTNISYVLQHDKPQQKHSRTLVCKRAWIKNPEFSPFHYTTQCKLQRKFSITGISGDWSWVVLSAKVYVKESCLPKGWGATYFEWPYMALFADWFTSCSDRTLVEHLFHKQQVSSSILTVTNKLVSLPLSYGTRHNPDGV